MKRYENIITWNYENSPHTATLCFLCWANQLHYISAGPPNCYWDWGVVSRSALESRSGTCYCYVTMWSSAMSACLLLRTQHLIGETVKPSVLFCHPRRRKWLCWLFRLSVCLFSILQVIITSRKPFKRRRFFFMRPLTLMTLRVLGKSPEFLWVSACLPSPPRYQWSASHMHAISESPRRVRYPLSRVPRSWAPELWS